MAVTTTPLRAVASSRMTMSSVAWPFQTISLVSYPMMETVITSLVFRLLSLNFPSMSVVSPVDPPLTKTAAPMTGPLASLTVPLTEPPLFWAPAAAENDTNRATAATTAAIPLNIEDLILFNIILKYWFCCVVCQCVCTFSSFLFFSLPSLPLFHLFRLFCLLSFFLFFSFLLPLSLSTLSLASYPPFPLFSHPLLPSLLSSLLPFFLLPLSFLPFLPPLFPSFSAAPFVSSASLAFCPFCSLPIFRLLAFSAPFTSFFLFCSKARST